MCTMTILDAIIQVLSGQSLTSLEIAVKINEMGLISPKRASKRMIDNAIQRHWRNGGESIQNLILVILSARMSNRLPIIPYLYPATLKNGRHK